MKFAKELEQDLVPEWRIKYLDYKVGKKHVKAVARATNRMNATPRTPAKSDVYPRTRSLYGTTSPVQPRPPSQSYSGVHDGPYESLRGSPAPLGADSRPDSDESDAGPFDTLMKTPPMPIPSHKQTPGPAEDTSKYGSFIPTPPLRERSFPFELPGPALTTSSAVRDEAQGSITPTRNGKSDTNPRPPNGRSYSIAVPPSAYEVGPTSTPPQRQSTFASLRHRLPPHGDMRPFVRRMFSNGNALAPTDSRRMDVDLVVVDQVRQRQNEFFRWMDKELDKVEKFYKSKEDEAGARLKVLRDQLHEMRNRRIEEVAAAQHSKHIRKEEERHALDLLADKQNGASKKDDDYRPNSRDRLAAWLDPFERVIDHTKARVLGPHVGSNSKALQNMGPSPAIRPNGQDFRPDDNRDYIRKPHYADDVPYRTAKRKLKLALQEFYRGMELLKSYALLNRTAFRKINKKYDKAVNAHPPLRYMSEKVNKAWFVQSDVLDGHLHSVEDLYARYFERGNHKVATGKLRSGRGRPADQSASAFRNGILIGIGAVFSIQGIVYGGELLYDEDPTVVTQTSYLLQIYAGYFLALYLFTWFCLDCSVWTRNKINYQFVFEFDPRHNLDWRQLSEFPSFLILVLGLFLWVNFSRFGTPEMYIYYPVILISVTTLLIFFPAPIIFHRSRKWLVYSHWRLLLAGLYPVEFRDFFLGDMYCSLTYFMSNIELFFCLYATYWSNPSQCNSTHSRLLGFFSALPGIWRALQCLRRYYDTRNIFPHLVNCGKYTATIMYYATLSMYRIKQTHTMLAVFVTFATINAVYTSIWDILMDWSLLQPGASKPLLRNVRGYKNPLWYYLAMILDPILRFNWIFYAIYTHDLQHNTLVSFLVAFSECTRRGMWVLFRVENEHCSNVARFKASRDVPLPYQLANESEADFQARRSQEIENEGEESPTSSTPVLQAESNLEAQVSHTGSTIRRRRPSFVARGRAMSNVFTYPGRAFTQVLADAHTQDFEKKRKPNEGGSGGDGEEGMLDGEGGSDSDGDEEDEVEDVEDRIRVGRVEELVRNGDEGRGERERDRRGSKGSKGSSSGSGGV